jgi:hypothetical protein
VWGNLFWFWWAVLEKKGTFGAHEIYSKFTGKMEGGG